MMSNQLKVTSGLLLILGLIALGSVYIESPYTINSKGVLFPEKEWKLIKLANGTIINILTDNQNKTVPFYSTTEFERGDHSGFLFDPKVRPGAPIKEGDTIGQLFSHQEKYKLLELQRELIEQQRLRDISTSGEKPQRTRAALEELHLAEADLETEKRNFERSRQLHAMKVIADQEFDQMENRYNQKKHQVLIARANYENLMAGSKKEEVQRIDATINAIKKQMAATSERLDAFKIKCPISGTLLQNVHKEPMEDEILAKVISNRQMILIMPVDVSQMKYLSEGLKVIIPSSPGRKEKQGEIISINQNVEQLNGHQAVFITCMVNNEDNSLYPGLKVEGNIIGDTVPLISHLKRFINTIRSN